MDRGRVGGPGDPTDVSTPSDDDLQELYDEAPCGQLSALPDGTIVKVNARLLGWLGYARHELVGVRRFTDLLTAGGRVYHETHMAPLLQMQGEISGIALDLRAADGRNRPALITSRVKPGPDGRPSLIRTVVIDARDRRAYEQELLWARRVADHELDRLQHLVASLQRSLLPSELRSPPGMEIAAHYHMASPEEVGGDFYDFFALPDGRWGFFLGDVCGKGVDAAATTATARYTLRAAAVYDPDPAVALANLNAVLYQEYHSDRHRHCTVVFGILTPSEGGYSATMASGGHPAPLLLRADGSAQYQAMLRGTLIGILPTARITTRTVPLGPGDMLILYTDGLTEARTGTGDGRYGSNALLAFVSDLAPASAAGAVAALADLVAVLPEGLDDDVAFMAMRVERP